MAGRLPGRRRAADCGNPQLECRYHPRNTSTITIGDDGMVEVYRKDGFGRGGVVIDVVGAFVPAETATSGRFVAQSTAQRILDTRDEPGTPVGAESTTRISLPDGVPDDAVALAINVTVVGTSSNGFFTVFPAGSPLPEASVLNADRRGQTRAASTIVPITSDGFDLFAKTGAHVVVDMTGWFTGESAADSGDGLFVPGVPARLRDTRPEPAPIHPGGTIAVPLPARTDAPAAVVISMTMVAPDRRGYVTAHAARPLAVRPRRGPACHGRSPPSSGSSPRRAPVSRSTRTPGRN